MAEKVELDVDLRNLINEVITLRSELGKVGTSVDNAFNSESAKGVADAVNDLQKEYADLKKSADVLKTSLKGATDPTAIKLYARSIAELELGMKQLETAGKKAGISLKDVNKQANTGKEVFEGLFGSFAKAALILGAIDVVKKFVISAVDLAESTTKAARSFEAFTGSADKAKSIVADLTGFANQKLLNTQDVLDAGKGLLAFGENSENLVPVLSRIADIGAATGKNFNELTTIYGKARTSGVLYAEDINQLVDAGIPIIQEFAKQMGVSNDQVKKLASEGKISFEELQLAFFNLTKEGSKFAGQAQLDAQTVGGAWRGLKSDLQPVVEEIGGFFSNLFQLTIFKARGFIADIKALFGKGEKITLNADLADKAALDADRRDYEAALNEQEKLTKEAAKRRAELNKKSSGDASKLAKEFEQAKINALKDGEQKEIAIEDLRYKELLKQLRKFHLDTTQAEEHHQTNLLQITAKYGIEKELKQRAELEKLRAARGEFEKEQNKERFDAGKKNLDEIKNLQDSEIDLTEQNFKNFISILEANGTDKAKIEEAQFNFDNIIKEKRLQTEIEFQEGLLALIGDGDANQTALIKNQIAKLRAQLDGLSIGPAAKPDKKKNFNFFSDILGLDPEDPDFDKKKKAIISAFSEITRGLQDLAQARVDEAQAQIEAADNQIQAAEKRVSSAQDALATEIEIAQLGFANNIDARNKELAAAEAQEAAAKTQRDKALQDKKKAQRAQIIQDSILQGSNILTSATEIYKAFSVIPFVGPFLGAAAVAFLIGSFVAAKSRALAATKVQAKHGITGEIGEKGIVAGPSHDNGGVPLEVEGGEFVYQDGKRISVVKKSATKTHFDLLQAINRDDRPSMLRYVEKLTGGISRNTETGTSSSGSVGISDKETHKLLAENNRLQKKMIQMEEDKVEYIDMGTYVLAKSKNREIKLKKG